MSGTQYWVRGSHSPTKAGRFYQRDIDFSVLIILTNLWKLLRLPEGPFYTTTNSTTWSTLATHLPSLCLGGLFPPSDLWHSWLIAVTSAVYVWTLRLTHALSCAWTTSKLCRWLAGVYQRITAPLFYSVNFLQSIFLLLSLSTYIIPWLASKVKGLLIFLSVTQEGNRTHHFNPPLGWAPRLFRAINPQRCRWSNQTHYLFLF